MSGDDLRALLRARPFVPFTMELIDGRRIRVPRPDWSIVSPNGLMMVVYQSRRGGPDIIDTAWVSQVTFDPPPPEPDIVVRG